MITVIKEDGYLMFYTNGFLFYDINIKYLALNHLELKNWFSEGLRNKVIELINE